MQLLRNLSRLTSADLITRLLYSNLLMGLTTAAVPQPASLAGLRHGPGNRAALRQVPAKNGAAAE